MRRYSRVIAVVASLLATLATSVVTPGVAEELLAGARRWRRGCRPGGCEQEGCRDQGDDEHCQNKPGEYAAAWGSPVWMVGSGAM